MDNSNPSTSEILRKYGGCSVNDLAKVYDPVNEDHEPSIITHSPYYATEDMLRSLQIFAGDFLIMSLNAQSINAKFS